MSDVTRRKFLGSAGMATAGLVASPAVLRLTALGAEAPILVGSLHDQSGALGTSGQPMVLSVELAVDEINADIESNQGYAQAQ